MKIVYKKRILALLIAAIIIIIISLLKPNTLPADPYDPSIGMSFYFRGTLLQTKPHPQGVELITDIKSQQKFIVTKSTTLEFRQRSTKEKKISPASLDDLKPNQKIQIKLLRRPSTKEWSVEAVTIFYQN